MENIRTIKQALEYILENCGVDSDCEKVAKTLVSDSLCLLDDEDTFNLYNDYLAENYPDDEYYSFDEETFNSIFDNPFKALQCGIFGDIQNFSDDYFRLNGYANIETASASDVAYNARNDRDFIEYIADNYDMAENLENGLGDTIDFIRENWEEIAGQLEKLA